jgi:hypothetical protein
LGYPLTQEKTTVGVSANPKSRFLLFGISFKNFMGNTVPTAAAAPQQDLNIYLQEIPSTVAMVKQLIDTGFFIS